ncbi:Methyl-accepting chemotaxis protein I, partial [Pseudomonas amygdali pv. sesami]
MSNVKSGLLSNMPVRAKLMVGFGLLILMILLMAYTGKEATDTLKRRAELSGDIAQFSSIARETLK